ncbi:MAG: hypothetical protein IID15_03005 [Candidatus Marinimicrobia bacterium]|nr:hypothetical protein [Candidatus Neomarinimicrobiota bacterium]
MTDATQAISGIPTSGMPAQLNRSTGTSIDSEQFLTLLVAQLRNQDPLEPMSNQEFAAQMAQFGQLERLANIDDSLKESLRAQVLSTQAVTNTMAAALIGKEVLAVGDSVELSQDGAVLNVSLSGPAETVTIKIYDNDGKLVRTIGQEDMPIGANTIAWDGLDNAGDALESGTYVYEVVAVDASGKLVDAILASSGIITGVSYEGGVATLMVGDRRFAMGDVISISAPGGS